MIGVKFTTTESKKAYVVIEAHHMFNDVWKCYPVEKQPPYKPNLIDCFSTDFINKCKNKKHMLLKGYLSKNDTKWYVNIVEEGDWHTQYLVHNNHKFWLQIWGEENMEACFILDENKQAILKSCGSDIREYTQD